MHLLQLLMIVTFMHSQCSPWPDGGLSANVARMGDPSYVVGFYVTWHVVRGCFFSTYITSGHFLIIAGSDLSYRHHWFDLFIKFIRFHNYWIVDKGDRFERVRQGLRLIGQQPFACPKILRLNRSFWCLKTLICHDFNRGRVLISCESFQFELFGQCQKRFQVFLKDICLTKIEEVNNGQ